MCYSSPMTNTTLSIQLKKIEGDDRNFTEIDSERLMCCRDTLFQLFQIKRDSGVVGGTLTFSTHKLPGRARKIRFLTTTWGGHAWKTRMAFCDPFSCSKQASPLFGALRERLSQAFRPTSASFYLWITFSPIFLPKE